MNQAERFRLTVRNSKRIAKLPFRIDSRLTTPKAQAAAAKWDKVVKARAEVRRRPKVEPR
jgi:hypothetical protein